jgi:hypothetical protein
VVKAARLRLRKRSCRSVDTGFILDGMVLCGDGNNGVRVFSIEARLASCFAIYLSL